MAHSLDRPTDTFIDIYHVRFWLREVMGSAFGAAERPQPWQLATRPKSGCRKRTSAGAERTPATFRARARETPAMAARTAKGRRSDHPTTGGYVPIASNTPCGHPLGGRLRFEI
jgi:hypothetical protein